jgi:hypothetical protein
MRRFIILIFTTALLFAACDKSKTDNGLTASYFVKNLHWGSKNNPLNGVTISWVNNSLASKIKWGYSQNYEMGEYAAVRKPNYLYYLYEYSFPTLTANAVVYYTICDSLSGKWNYKNYFKTASDNEASTFSFTVVGDTRTNVDVWGKVSESVEPADFSLFMGDLVEDGNNDSLWENWYNYGKEYLSRTILFHTIGNHDYPDSGRVYLNQFVMPGNERYYSFNFRNAVFICLNSEKPADPAQYQWLLNTLENNKTKTWKFVFFHKPFFTNGSHQGEMDAYFDTWWKAFDDYGVDMIFNGHTHNYQRTIPVNRFSTPVSAPIPYGDKPYEGRCQIVSGGGGAPLISASDEWFTAVSDSIYEFVRLNIKGNNLTLVAKDINGNTIDQLTLQK